MNPSSHIVPSLRGFREGSISSVATNRSKNSDSTVNILHIGPGYKLIKKIGSGNFGEIWLAQSLPPFKRSVAVKMEKKKRRFSQLQLEYRFYRRFGRNSFTPDVFYFCTTPQYNALVMELLGPTLEDIYFYNNCVFSIKTVLLISMQLITIFDFIHRHGIVYRDAKPQNFLISGNIKENRIMIVDFGLAKQCIDPLTKIHQPYVENLSLTGTARYMSINTHLGREQSRRDDLESIGHMLIYFLKGKLPWQGLNIADSAEHYSLIGKIKVQTRIPDLCEGIPEIFGDYLTYCRNLTYFERPDYDKLYNNFLKYYKLFNFEDDFFDWKIPESHITSVSNSKECEELTPLTPFHLPSSSQTRPFSYPSPFSKIQSYPSLTTNVFNQNNLHHIVEKDPRDLKNFEQFVGKCETKNASFLNTNESIDKKIYSCIKCCFPKRRHSNSVKIFSQNNTSLEYF